MTKRAFDAVLAAVGLVILAPVLAVIAVLIKLDSKGPVFFRQERIGKDGRPFGSSSSAPWWTTPTTSDRG